jgi:C1A family cysteine protease
MTAGKVVAFLGVVALSLVAFQQYMPVTAQNETEMQQLWAAWKTQFGKHYSTPQEDEARFLIFQQNYAKVQAHNADPTQTFTMAMNLFADLTGEEFSAQMASCHGTGVGDEYCPSAVDCPTYPDANFTSINWTTTGAVTPIKNQGQCGSCWAFSTTGALEALYFLNQSQKLLVSFSEQQLVDCASSCYGCDGCWPYMAMEYTAQYGIEPEKVYPYKGVQGTCQYKSSLAIKVNTNYSCVTQKSVDQLKAALQIQPVSVAVEADQNAWQLYSKGVVTSGCGATLDHAVLLTGFGTYDNQQAWYVKNSWGTSWGLNGYIWLGTSTSQNTGYGVCGILRCGTLPTDE